MNNPTLQTTEHAMPGSNLCTEAEATALVHTFYARVREDEVLGPIFEAHIDD